MIYFTVKEVREYLIEHGFVYTLRKPRGTGITQAAEGGSYQKPILFADVDVELIEENITDSKQLLAYVAYSGLGPRGLEGLESCAKKWLSLAQQLSGEELHLYKATIVRLYSKCQ